MVNYHLSKYQISNINKKHHDKLKLSLLNLLGGKCIICNEKDIDVLVTDHIFDDGIRDRKIHGHLHVRRKYIKNPILAKQKLQVLCHNCNLKKQLIHSELKRLSRYGIPPF